MHEVMVAAVEEAGGTVVPIEQASALMFADPMAADAFRGILDPAPNVEWVQLPYAGIETFSHNLDTDRIWTCGKGVYAAPVAEWILTALLASFRAIPRYVRRRAGRARKVEIYAGPNLRFSAAAASPMPSWSSSLCSSAMSPWCADETRHTRGPRAR